MASPCLLPRSQFSDLLITDCCDSMSEEEERCELSATYHSRRKIKMALIDQRSKRVMAFYEKVIKVKADVAAFLINRFPSA